MDALELNRIRQRTKRDLAESLPESLEGGYQVADAAQGGYVAFTPLGDIWRTPSSQIPVGATPYPARLRSFSLLLSDVTMTADVTNYWAFVIYRNRFSNNPSQILAKSSSITNMSQGRLFLFGESNIDQDISNSFWPHEYLGLSITKNGAAPPLLGLWAVAVFEPLGDAS